MRPADVSLPAAQTQQREVHMCGAAGPGPGAGARGSGFPAAPQGRGRGLPASGG